MQTITEMCFIEGLYLYSEVGSSGIGVLAHEQGSQVLLAVPVCVRRTQQRGASQDACIGGGYSR